MKLCILKFALLICSTNAGRDAPIRKRFGPFASSGRPLRVPLPGRNRYPAPPEAYRQPFLGPRPLDPVPYDRHETAAAPVPSQKRVLVLPIISEGYASTSFHGGSNRRNDDDVDDARDNDIAVTTTTTTTTTVPSVATTAATTSTTTVPDTIREQQLKKSEDQQLQIHLRDLEKLKRQQEDVDKFFSVQLSSSFGGGGGGRPATTRKAIKGSVEKVPLFTTTTTTTTMTTTTTTKSPFILEPGNDGDYAEEVVEDPDQYVRFVASPPKQINVAVPPPTASRPFRTSGYPSGGRQPVDDRTTLLASDRPSTSTKTLDKEGNYYPLGKPPPKQQPPPGRNRLVQLQQPPPPKQTTSIFDFLIPSFLSGKKPTAAPKLSPELTPPGRIKKLPVPTRPPNTFPQPDALGGRLNPILIKVPTGYRPGALPPRAFPKPPTLQDWQSHQQNVLSSRRGMGQLPPRADQNEVALDEVRKPLPMTSEPMIGLPRVPPSRKQSPFLSGKRTLTPPRVGTRTYAAMLKDPVFMRNLTKAHVYHDKSKSGNINGLGSSGVTYLPHSNPFFFRRKGEAAAPDHVLQDVAPPSMKLAWQFGRPDVHVVYKPIGTRKPRPAPTTTTRPAPTSPPAKVASGAGNLVIGSEDQLKDLLLDDHDFATYLTHLDDSLLDSMSQEDDDDSAYLDRVFTPSASPKDSDWYVLNEKGQRERPMSEGEIGQILKLLEEQYEGEGPKEQEEDDFKAVSLSGGFFPSNGPTAEDAPASGSS